MTDLHPLTQRLTGDGGHFQGMFKPALIEALDAIIRDELAPPTYLVSGVRFPDHPDTKVEVQASFIQSGNQVQMALIGVEPVLLVQPEFDSELNLTTFITTAVDLPPAGLVQVLEVLLDSARQVVEQQGGTPSGE